jgi:hypothetical protein
MSGGYLIREKKSGMRNSLKLRGFTTFHYWAAIYITDVLRLTLIFGLFVGGQVIVSQVFHTYFSITNGIPVFGE